MDTRIREYDVAGNLISSQTATMAYDWQADPPTVTTTVTDDATGDVVSTETRLVTERAVARRQIVETWGQRRTELIAAYGELDTVAPDIVAANTALQHATTTNAVVAAVKEYGAANLTALAAIKDAQESVMGALGVIEDAVIWLDAELSDMRKEGG